MKKDSFSLSIPILCTFLLAILLVVFFFVEHMIRTAPPSSVQLATYGEVLAAEEADSGVLVTIRHIGGPSEYSGTHQYFIDDSTTITDAAMDALLDGNVGMLVWVRTPVLRKSEISSADEYVFPCEKFLIRQPTVPDWWPES